MANKHRPRGRPRGSGKNDTPHLAQVADLLVREPSLTPTAAMKRIMRSCKDWDAASEAALLRRWQGKWNVGRNTLLAEAREHARPKPVVCASHYYPWTATEIVRLQYQRLMEDQRRMHQLIDPTYLRRMRDLIDPPYLRQMRDLIDPPYLREIRRTHELQQLPDPFKYYR